MYPTANRHRCGKPTILGSFSYGFKDFPHILYVCCRISLKIKKHPPPIQEHQLARRLRSWICSSWAASASVRKRMPWALDDCAFFRTCWAAGNSAPQLGRATNPGRDEQKNGCLGNMLIPVESKRIQKMKSVGLGVLKT